MSDPYRNESVSAFKIALFAIVTLLMEVRAHCVVWDDAHSSKAAGEMQQVVRLHCTPLRIFGGCGVQIDDRWVLTAKHCVRIWSPMNLQVRAGDSRAEVKRVILHPEKAVDLALIELSGVGIPMRTKVAFFKESAKTGAKLWLGGYGFSGRIGKWPWPGRFVSGYNRLDGISGKRGRMRLDRGDVLPLLFDSGSPVFVEKDGRWFLFGITVTASNRLFPKYGDRSHHQLVGSETEWIKAVLGL